jgi:hypothetical protein
VDLGYGIGGGVFGNGVGGDRIMRLRGGTKYLELVRKRDIFSGFVLL